MILVARIYATICVACLALAVALPFWYSWHTAFVWGMLGCFGCECCRQEMRFYRGRLAS